MEFTIGQIAKLLDGTVKGDSDLRISALNDIAKAQPNQITFLSNPKYEPLIYTTVAAAVIVKTDFVPNKTINTNLIFVKNPYLSFATLMEEYQKNITPEKIGIEEPYHRGKNVKIGNNFYQGAFSYIADNVTIGDNVKIYPHTFIGDNVVIGNNTVLYSGVKFYASTQVGDDCVIHAGAILGSAGFGFAPREDGSYKPIPQLGNVVIGDNVSIGANTTVDRATLLGKSTIIHSGVKLDNLVQIAHNVEIGENTVIASQAGISGSSKVGERCILAGQVGISGHVTVANDTVLGGQAGVAHSIRKEGQKLVGTPVIDQKEYFKSSVIFRQLPSMKAKLSQLEKQLEQKK